MSFRKDKTPVEILDRPESLEDKIDRNPNHDPVPTGFGPPSPAPTSQPSFSTDVDERSLYSSSRPAQQPSRSGTRTSQPCRHASARHKMLASQSPGLALFNKVRKRIGVVLTDCNLEKYSDLFFGRVRSFLVPSIL